MIGQFFRGKKNNISLPPRCEVVKIRRAKHDKNIQALTCCNNTETLSHSEPLWIPPCSLPLRLATGLLLIRVRLFIRLCNCTQSGRWWLMCEIITRSSVDGMRALRSRTSPIWLSLVYILILAPAWPLRLRVNLEDAIK